MRTLPILQPKRSAAFRAAIFVAAIFIGSLTASPADWIRAGVDVKQPLWGLRGGLEFAIPPGSFSSGSGGPRGLIRIGYPTLPDGTCDLINFIATEPIVQGKRGFSELERSTIDQQPGKLISARDTTSKGEAISALSTGAVTDLGNGVEELSLHLAIERYENGAHVRLVLTQRSDVPDELRLQVYAEPDSAPLDRCILTATMGNKARTRLLWLKDGPVSSLALYATHHGTGFAPHTFFPLVRLPRGASGDVLVAITNEEADPVSASASLSRFWQYRGEKVTQYWRKPASDLNDNLECAVNARYTYWLSQTPLPGGIAFENFELTEPYRDGQQFIFGVTRRSPAQLLELKSQ